MSRKFIILFIVALTIISGCKKDERGVPYSWDKIHAGADGLVMEFLPESPPEEILTSATSELIPLKIGIKAMNRGAYDITGGEIGITVEEDYISMDDVKKQVSIPGKSIFNSNGDREILFFNGKTKKRQASTEKHQSQILATACYRYKTEAKATVCIDTDSLNLKGKPKACSAKELTFTNQGAPVAVTKITPKIYIKDEISTISPEFYIKIENVGKGQVINPDSDVLSACSPEIGSDEKFWNVIKAKAILSDKELRCTPNPLNMKEKEENIIKCALPEDIDSNIPSYSAPLTIDIDYGYSSSITKEVTLKREIG